jgi:3-oxoacyl-[acyl-carrier protein] reductase
MEVKGSVAVVTGGASGIGEAVAKDLAKAGAKVVIGDVNQDNIDKVVGEIKSAGGEAVGVVGDVTKDADMAKLMDTAVDSFGQINIVVPSAGIIKDALFVSPDRETGKVKKAMSTDAFRAVIEVNLVGTFITLREAAVRMVDNGWKGVLFTVSSVNKAGAPGQVNYAATKVAVALWPKIMVGEFQMKGIKNIRVVGIAPGYVGTPMVKGMNQKALDSILSTVHIGRLIEPEEIADLIKHVCENEAIDATTIEITAGVMTGNLAK